MNRADNRLLIDPLPDIERFQPASIELTLGGEFLNPDGTTHIGQLDQETNALCLDGSLAFEYPEGAAETTGLQLRPDQFALATTKEMVCIPTDLVAQVNGKSSLGRLGLLVHATAGFIDPGFRGQITLELKNIGPDPIFLPEGMVVCQLVFFETRSPATRPYGSQGLGSHYQDQSGVTPSRL